MPQDTAGSATGAPPRWHTCALTPLAQVYNQMHGRASSEPSGLPGDEERHVPDIQPESLIMEGKDFTGM